jgi:predicted Zn-dependent protease
LKRLLPLILLAATSAAGATVQLPEMGSSSAAVLAPDQEARIGKEMLQRLRRAGRLVEDDRPLQSYIEGLGARLTAGLATPTKFTFFIVDDPSINAFAMPGGYIGIHTGLIRAARTESELAAVIAHEMAHVTQHHLARSFEKASEMNLPATAAVIAAIILGAKDPNLGQAALATSMASTQQAQLDFTRANEQEADRVGMTLLASAGFDPEGMPDFFQRLQRETRYYGQGLPEFLSTHPVTSSRIADSRNRAAQLPPGHLDPDDDFPLLKMRLEVHTSSDPAALAKRLADRLSSAPPAEAQSVRYGYALALARAGQFAAARKQLKPLLDENPARILYVEAAATIEQQARKPAKAAAMLRNALALYPHNPILTVSLANLLLQENQAQDAQKLLRGYTRAHPDDPQGFQLLARSESKLGHKGAGHLAQAEYYVLIGELPLAIDQLQTARRLPELDDYHTARVDARLKELQADQHQAQQ